MNCLLVRSALTPSPWGKEQVVPILPGFTRGEPQSLTSQRSESSPLTSYLRIGSYVVAERGLLIF